VKLCTRLTHWFELTCCRLGRCRQRASQRKERLALLSLVPTCAYVDVCSCLVVMDVAVSSPTPIPYTHTESVPIATAGAKATAAELPVLNDPNREPNHPVNVVLPDGPFPTALPECKCMKCDVSGQYNVVLRHMKKCYPRGATVHDRQLRCMYTQYWRRAWAPGDAPVDGSVPRCRLHALHICYTWGRPTAD
jgi:hypothetical protein